MAGDQEVIGSDHPSPSLEISLDIGGMVGGGGVEVQNLEPTEQGLDIGALLYGPGGHGGAVHQLMPDYGRGRDIVSQGAEAGTQFLRPISQQPNTDVRIQQIHLVELHDAVVDFILGDADIDPRLVEEVVPQRPLGHQA